MLRAVPLDQAKKVDAKRTPLEPAELRDVLAKGHLQALGSQPSDNRLGIAWSQVNLETGQTKSAYNFNWGNVIAGPGWTGEWHTLQLPSNEPPNYRAYPTAVDGAADYWKVVERMNRERSGRLFAAFDAGDVDAAAAELRAAGYFTAPLAPYQSTMRVFFKRYKETLGVGPSLARRVTIAGILCALAAAAAAYFASR